MVTYEQLKSIPIQTITDRLSAAPLNSYHVVVKEVADKEPATETQQALASLWGLLSVQLVHNDDRGASLSSLAIFTNGQETFLPEDVTAEEASDIWLWLQEIEHVGLRAKLADLLWQSRKLKDKNHLAAFLAIESYLSLANEVGSDDSILLLKRAGRVARELGAAGKDHLAKVCDEVRRQIVSTEIAKTHGLTYDLYLMLFRLQPERFSEIADRALMVAEYHETVSKNFELAIPYLELVQEHRRKVNDKEGLAKIIDKMAACCLAKTEFYRSTGNPFAAESALKQAIRYSQGRAAADKMNELRSLLAVLQRERLQKLRLIQTEIPDGLKIAEAAQETITKCGNAEEALFALAGIADVTDVASLRAYTDKMMKESPLYFLTTPVQLDGKGRTAARPTEAADLKRFEMFKLLMPIIQLQGSVIIEPARQRFAANHAISANGIARLMAGNPLVPDERLFLFAKGLKLGLEGDFITSLHLLIPQLENGIRCLLEKSGMATSYFVDSEVEEEKTLGGYLALDALKKLMGDSLVLTLQFIFTEKGGINLRNNLSHGLYDPQNFYSPYAIYAWWIILKMCLFPVERAGSAEPLEE